MGLENWGGCKNPFFLGAFALIVSGKWNINRIQKRSNWLKSSHTTSFQPLCKTFKGKQINNWKTSCSEPQTKNPRPKKTQKIRMSDTHTPGRDGSRQGVWQWTRQRGSKDYDYVAALHLDDTGASHLVGALALKPPPPLGIQSKSYIPKRPPEGENGVVF